MVAPRVGVEEKSESSWRAYFLGGSFFLATQVTPDSHDIIEISNHRYHTYLEPHTFNCKWQFQFDDSKSLDRKWLEITKRPLLPCCLGFQVGLRFQPAEAVFGGFWGIKFQARMEDSHMCKKRPLSLFWMQKMPFKSKNSWNAILSDN